MNEVIRVQGRDLSPKNIEDIRKLLAEHPQWHRTRLSREICSAWEWQDEAGRLKDMACRTMLLKLERRGFFTLPQQRQKSVNHFRGKSFQPVLHNTSTLNTSLRTIRPITLSSLDHGHEAQLWQTLLAQYHYLGFTTCVGQTLRYIAYANDGRPLACLLFGAAAWKTAPRDIFIGWNREQREKNLSRVVNNMRFLIPPWVNIPHLASHIIAMALRRLPVDWRVKYGFEPVLVETFVEQNRFKGTCYQAANWQCVGVTSGRTRQDQYNQIKAPIKDIYLYPLCRDFKTKLCAEEL
ncbi:MAG: Druantia anti-phage system protein DruA [Kiritimatiellia bacterium]